MSAQGGVNYALRRVQEIGGGSARFTIVLWRTGAAWSIVNHHSSTLPEADDAGDTRAASAKRENKP